VRSQASLFLLSGARGGEYVFQGGELGKQLMNVHKALFGASLLGMFSLGWRVAEGWLCTCDIREHLEITKPAVHVPGEGGGEG